MAIERNDIIPRIPTGLLVSEELPESFRRGAHLRTHLTDIISAQTWVVNNAEALGVSADYAEGVQRSRDTLIELLSYYDLEEYFAEGVLPEKVKAGE